MKPKLLAFISITLLAFLFTNPVFAQNYSFGLDREVVHVYVNDDGTIDVEYSFTFSNSPGASPIDFVDVGLPNNNYNLGNITADLDGNPVAVTGDYQGEGCCGVAVELRSRAIPPGASGTVNVRIPGIEKMLYPDDEDSQYASLVFSPTWFGSSYVRGQTDLTLILHLPPGVQPEEPKYHVPSSNWPGNTEPIYGFDGEDRITYTWRSSAANGYTQYYFGSSFPRQYVPADAIYTPSVFDRLGILPEDMIGFAMMCCFGGLFFGLPIMGAVQANRRKMQYLPPKVSIEGHGIKRGLTAVEAAILMGQPLEKIMTMILFGVIKKNAAQVEKRDPLELSIIKDGLGNLREYEREFLDAFKEKDSPNRRKVLQTMAVGLVKEVTNKMKGFSRKETIEYYTSINEKAWQQIAAAGTPEIQSQMLEDALEWTMLDKDYDTRTRRTFTGPVFMPTWWGRYDPVYRQAAGPMPTLQGTQGSGGGKASLPGADFAASVVTNTQTFAQRVLGGGFAESVTQVTNPPPKPSSSRGYRGSGGGCACACACAGCACACAGGGR